MKLISLFAGVGGFDLAAERAHIEPAVCCEIDPSARGVLKHRFPNAFFVDDVKEITGDKLRGFGLDPATTIISGGFPCQDVSVAGRRQGFEGERSSLFFEIVRILREFNPKWFVLENVPGLFTSHGGRDMGAVVGTLAELGYVFGWRVLDSQFFGVPQRRKRVFIVGCAGDGGGMVEQVLFESEGGFGDSSKVVTAGEEIAGSSGNGVISTLQGGGRRSYRVDAESAAGVTVLGEQTHALTASMDKGASEDGTGRANPIIGFSHTQGLDAQASETSFPTLRNGGAGMAVSVAPTLSASNNLSRLPQSSEVTSQIEAVHGAISTVRRLTPRECERLQGFPDDWTAKRFDFKKGTVVAQADSARYRQMGNAVTVNVVEWIFRRLLTAENNSVSIPDVAE